MKVKDKFKQLKKEKRKAFIAYVPFGFPNIKLTKSICLTLEESGVDIIELGLPFSDPLADGPIIQEATSLALTKGANVDKFFNMLKQLTKTLKIPIVIMSYYNPIFRFGLDKFFKRMESTGVSALTVVDLPLQESKDYLAKARKFNLETVFFITPTTSNKRIREIAKASKGFIYYISVTGITGPKSFSYSSVKAHVQKVKKISSLSVCVGFGIHTREQVRRISAFSDGVIIGSSIVKFIENHYRKKRFLSELRKYIASLCMRR